ncbi:hypothetical protein FHS79_002973 [Polymorphobacter multimanifer]|uniref:AAA+ ATPase domain-containing protein n=1 Tax=Polymorphobacter multimanifer TaxID=1070431 RepID=A0A841LHV7_9SPHN|nr:DUF815 domain-containing protein [Polymorphobacter multimanifer]MBB6228782.1 hypothetical protein [Polymorphobacter multimanifer]
MNDSQAALAQSLARIAAAVQALAAGLAPPVARGADPAEGDWFVWSEGALRRVPRPRTTPLALFQGVDAQRAALVENVRRHGAGLPAHDVLLWGARGMGKSSLVRAVHAAATDAASGPVALVQVAREDVAGLARLFERLADIDRPFTVFLDDLAFDASGAEVHALRALLDGGIEARPEQVRLMVTSNRRHLLPSTLAAADADDANPPDANPRDTRDDQLALADRFGLRLGFHNCDQPTYLAMCSAYAAAHGLAFDPAAALAFAAGRGARSGRVAWHFIVDAAGAQRVRL